MNPKIDNILARYFSGEATAADLAELDNWLAASTENEKLFDQLTVLYEKSAPVNASHQPDTAKAMAHFKEHIGKPAAETTNARPLRRKDFYWPVAAIILLLIGLFLVPQITKNKAGQPIQLATTDTQAVYYLPDSTLVTLAPHSQLNYDKNFNTTNRTIRLSGKALFEVGTRGHGQFTVEAGNVIIKDIGTIFTVEAYKEESETKVFVESGLVQVSGFAEQSVEVPAGVTAVIDNVSNSVELIEMERELQPQEDTEALFVFDAIPLSEVVLQLSQHYHIGIRLVGATLGSRQISVQFYNENIDTILDIIAETLELKLSKENGTYILSQ